MFKLLLFVVAAVWITVESKRDSPLPKNGCRLDGIFETNSKKSEAKEGFYTRCTSGVCCYNDPIDVGCFDNGPDTKWCHHVKLPQSPLEIGPEFGFFTPEGQRSRIDIKRLKSSVKALEFDNSKELYFLVHGFGQNWPKEWIFPMKDALLQQGHNVIITRWTRGSAMPDYFQATANTRVMGVVIAKVLESMMDIHELALERTNLVGFSLGSHVMGFAGKQLIKDGHTGLRRIYGLDPAGPLFAYGDPVPVDPTAALTKDDAQFVVAFHSNGGLLIKQGFGTMQEMGDIDFYANGGRFQPGCADSAEEVIHDMANLQFVVSCSHNLAPWYFISTILQDHSDCRFTAYECKSTDDWESGKCTTCSEHGCPIAGYGTDVKFSGSGMHMFGATSNTQRVHADFCGKVWVLTMEIEKLLYKGGFALYDTNGQIDAKISGDDGRMTETFAFNKPSDRIKKSSTVSRVMVWDYDISAPERIHLQYERRLGFTASSIHVSKISLAPIDQPDQVFMVEGEFVMKTGKELTVTLKAKK